ncbi:MAG: hypothetical protein CFE44_18135 [Burkholderiales bacterium PBB4]|nr:MAG: hypothetical protein CFE44_18135 [Burkholderiales bacterium PBB4]
MKTKIFQIRLSEEDDAILAKAAKEARMTKSAMGRNFLHEGLAGYDRKHEDFVQRGKVLEENVSHIHELVAVVAAQVSALDLPRKPNDRIPEMTSHLKQGFELSEGIQVGQKRGLFHKGGK